MNTRVALFAIAGFLLLVGIVVFVERGYFASLFFDAHTIGNLGWANKDDKALQLTAIIAGGLAGAGVLLALLTSLAPLFPKEPTGRPIVLGLNRTGILLFVLLLVIVWPLCWLPFIMNGCKGERAPT